MRVIAYSSGAWPCGIADYHRKLSHGLAAHLRCDTVLLPTDTVYRDQPLALLRRRSHYSRLAARSQTYDASILDLITHWNGGRPGENTLPTFINHLRGPLFMIVHEWPPSLDPERDAKSLPRKVVSNMASLVSRMVERGGLAYDDWLQRRLFARAAHVLVHSEALRDKLLALGVPADRVSFRVFPVGALPSEGDTSVADAIGQQFAQRRKIVIFGFPHPRKSLELAVQALPHLPPDVMLLFVGGTDGAFRQKYVQSLLELAGSLGVRDRLEFVGEVPEAALQATFSLAEFALAPFSIATGSSSFSYLMAAGVPIVASRLPEHQALEREGAGIVLFDSGDVSALTRAVSTLLEDKDRQQSLAAQNRAFAARHTYTHLAETIRERLNDMVISHREPVHP